MPRVTIDGQELTVGEGVTVLQAAREAGIDIPTLCHLEGTEPFTSCMVCAVRDMDTGRMLPACSAPAAEGMEIDTVGEGVTAERRAVIELLLSEHLGNCEGPCRQACPAHLDIPRMFTRIDEEDHAGAAAMALDALVLPHSLSMICPAPCEMTCRRGLHDSPVGIRNLVRFVAADAEPPDCAPERAERVAIVGAGPMGLAAAYALRRKGIAVTVFDEHDEPGGMLRYGVPAEKLPREILAREVDRIRRMGAVFQLSTHVTVAALKEEFQAIVLAVGKLNPTLESELGVEIGKNGLVVDPGTGRTSDLTVFAGGDAVRATQRAVNSVADGKAVAVAVDQLLRGESVIAPRKRFNSTIGCPQHIEMQEFVSRADPHDRYDAAEATKESKRCLHCECQKPDSCKLREYAEVYHADPDRFAARMRATCTQVLDHAEVSFEPGKCIKCGICIRIAEQAGEPLGLSFLDRGYDTRVGAPFRRSMQDALQKAAADCVEACPTAALSWR